MKIRKYMPQFIALISGLFLLACLLPGMIPLKTPTPVPMPAMETNADKVLAVLKGNDYVRLEALAKEQYTEQDYAKPGTLKFTVNVTDKKKPIYFSYGWCAINQNTLQQNIQHIKVTLYLNGDKLSQDVVHALSYTLPNNQVCADLGVLMSNWPAGKYELKSVATFDQKINDGTSDYPPGDYILDYNVDVPS